MTYVVIAGLLLSWQHWMSGC